MPKIENARSKQAKKFLQNVCVMLSHDYNLETLRCERCGRVPYEGILVYLDGLLQQPIHDYSVERTQITFTHQLQVGNTITVIVKTSGTESDVRTTIRVHKRASVFKFRRKH